MRLRINREFALLLTIGAASMCPALAHAQAAPSTESAARPDLALGYSYLHSNAPQGGCGCFNMNGGSAYLRLAARAGRVGRWSAMSSRGYAGSVSSRRIRSHLSAPSPRECAILPPVSHSSLHPFGQVLAGMAHSSGTLVQGSILQPPMPAQHSQATSAVVSICASTALSPSVSSKPTIC